MRNATEITKSNLASSSHWEGTSSNVQTSKRHDFLAMDAAMHTAQRPLSSAPFPTKQTSQSVS